MQHNDSPHNVQRPTYTMQRPPGSSGALLAQLQPTHPELSPAPIDLAFLCSSACARLCVSACARRDRAIDVDLHRTFPAHALYARAARPRGCRPGRNEAVEAMRNVLLACAPPYLSDRSLVSM